MNNLNNAIGCSIKADDFSMLFRQANQCVIKNGIETSPRGFKIKELINVNLLLTNPRNRILFSRIRKHSHAYAVGEFLWYARGAEDLDSLAFYSQRLREYSDDGRTLNSAYGSRIFGTHKDFPNQWENVKNKLLADNDTRQGVININYPQDQNRVTKDVTCTLSLQFLIREKKLHMIVNMRSSDASTGLLYDVFCFTMLQELMLFELNRKKLEIELGYYMHNAGSFHMYEDAFDRMKKVFGEECEATPMQPIMNDQLEDLQKDEFLLRTESRLIDVDKYDEPWKWMTVQLNKKLKQKLK